MIGRADIEESKSNVAMNAWLPQASYPCGNFSDTSSLKFQRTKGSIGHAFAVCIRTENQNQVSFYPFVPHEIRSEEHTSELQSLMRISYAVLCLKKKRTKQVAIAEIATTTVMRPVCTAVRVM